MDVYKDLVQAAHCFWETNHMSNNTKVNIHVHRYACIYINSPYKRVLKSNGLELYLLTFKDLS